MNSRVVKEANPSVLNGKRQDPKRGAGAKERYITDAIGKLFVNVKHHEESDDLFDFDPRATTTDIDNMITLLNAERKIAKRREIQARADLAIAQRERLEY